MFPPGVGGSEMYAYELANALGEAGHTVDVYTQAIPNETPSIRLDDNVSVTPVCQARNFLVTFETLYYSINVRRQVNLNRYDVIHGTLMPASTIALSPKRSIEPQVVVTSHGTSLGETLSHTPEIPSDYLLRYFFHPMNVVMDNIAGRSADHVIAISTITRDQLANTYRFDADRLSLIPHGVNTDRFYPRSESHPAVSTKKTSILFVGRLASRKGVSRAIESIATLRDDAVELLIAGTGRHEDRLKQLAQDCGVDENVKFLGFVPDDKLPVLYSAADVFVFPSRYEGFGLVVLEAMACGTPVVGTPVGGVPDIVEDGKTGFVVDHDVEDIGAKLRHCHENPVLLEEMSVTAAAKARTMDWRHVATQVEDVYRSVLDDG